ncbi:MAG: hypothetical protein ACJAU5_000734 [Maricaulis maris]|jgi:hypothetical protein|uniref:Uncharacterized protein n=1 Tax=Maricaulis maris (strain MCS10) TaxID=394221 RepID=Q0ATS0_MARMM|nr:MULTISPECIES: hypothetical protein [Maricaulis]ABI64317.1 hypothetical protein Mmar10_0021 [Maricaulis maris MCS10]MAC87933.1 hypothetical protein [Maricaulis sp.]
MNRIGRASFAAIALSGWMTSSAAFAGDPQDGAGIQHVCIEAGFAEPVCTCIVREAGSRFTHAQMHVLALAIPDLRRISEDPTLIADNEDAEHLSADQLATLRQRAEDADRVIQQACGIGLSLDAG